MTADRSLERIQALDILRGLALFGMILVHFHQKARLEVTGLEDLIGWAVWVLVEQKAWGTFAFLFGVGFAVLLRRLEARHAPVVTTYLRRLAGLAVFGVIAEVFLGFHILFAYACWGLVLLLIRRWSTRTLLVAAAVAACARPVAAELTALYGWWTGVQPGPVAAAELYRAVHSAASGSDYGALVSARWDLFVGASLPHTWRDLLPDVNLALFILGLLAVRHRYIDEPLRHARGIAGWMGFGALAWAMSWLVLRHVPDLGIPGTGWPLAFGLGLVQEQWLCLTYVGAVLLLLARWPQWTARLAAFGWTGRMALTNYFLQAAVLDVLTSGYGLGLRLRPLRYVGAAVLLFALQASFSRAWLARYRFGPLEWLWRIVTYGRIEPIRLMVSSRPGRVRGNPRP